MLFALSVLAMQVFLHTYATDGIRPQIARNAGHQLAPAGVPAELLRLYVQEPFTGAKLGTQLLGRAEDTARQRGATVLWLTPWVHNHRALAFYARCGYTDYGLTYFTLEGESHQNRVFAKQLTASG